MTEVVDDILEVGLNQAEVSDLMRESGDEQEAKKIKLKGSKNGKDYYESLKELNLTDVQFDELMAEVEGPDAAPSANSSPSSNKVISKSTPSCFQNTKKKVNLQYQHSKFLFLIGVQECGKLRHISESEAEELFCSLQSNTNIDELIHIDCVRAEFKSLHEMDNKEFQIEFGDYKSLSWFRAHVNKFLCNAVVLPPTPFRNKMAEGSKLFYTWRLFLPGFFRRKCPRSVTQILIKSNNIKGTIDVESFVPPESPDGTCIMTWKVSPLTDSFLNESHSCSLAPRKIIIYYGIIPIEVQKICSEV